MVFLTEQIAARLEARFVHFHANLPFVSQRSVETIDFLTVDELRGLINVIEGRRDRALFLIAYRHGLRVSEVGMLRVTDFDDKQLKLMCHRVKGGIAGVHPMQSDEVRLLKSYLRNREHDSPILFPSNRGVPISRVMLHKLMRQYGERAKLPEDKRHFHSLRHSIAVHLYDAGQDVRFVQDWLGHARIQNTVIYTHLSTATREAKARAAFMKLPRF